MPLIIVSNAIKRKITQTLPRNVFHVMRQNTMVLQIPTMLPSDFQQVVKIVIPPALAGSLLNTENMTQNPFQSIQESTMVNGITAVIATPIRPVMHSLPASIAIRIIRLI